MLDLTAAAVGPRLLERLVPVGQKHVGVDAGARGSRAPQLVAERVPPAPIASSISDTPLGGSGAAVAAIVVTVPTRARAWADATSGLPGCGLPDAQLGSGQSAGRTTEVVREAEAEKERAGALGGPKPGLRPLASRCVSALRRGRRETRSC